VALRIEITINPLGDRKFRVERIAVVLDEPTGAVKRAAGLLRRSERASRCAGV
jgi:hypothetical protein